MKAEQLALRSNPSACKALLWSVASLLATDSISVSALAAAGEIRGGFRRLSTASLANLAWAVGTLKVAPELLLGIGDELLHLPFASEEIL